MTIHPDGRTELSMLIASNPNRVYKTKLLFFDSRGQKINEQWPYIRFFVNSTWNEFRRSDLAVVQSSVRRIATIRRSDDCVRP